MKLIGFAVLSLLLQLESRVRVEGQVWTSQNSKARQAGQPNATQRESWGYESHYRKAGGERKGVKEIKAMKLQTEVHKAALGQGHFLYFSLSRTAWAENALKVKTRPQKGGSMQCLLSSSVRNNTKRHKKTSSSSSLTDQNQWDIRQGWGECISKTSILGVEGNCRSALWLVQSGCSETETLPFKSSNSSCEVGNAPVESEIKPLFKTKVVSGFGH